MFSFLNPFFLYFAAAAAVPLVLHMMQRRRVVVVPFSTIRFLKMAQKRSSNRIRMENFLLWVLRTLLMLALSIAFAMPLMRTAAFGKFLGRTKRDVAIVIDASYSMGYQTGKETVFDKAIACASSVIEGLDDGDRICIFLANDDVKQVLSLKSSQSKEAALSQLRTLTVGLTSSQLCPATLAAVEELKQAERRERELHIITDGQALPWTGFRQNDTNYPAATQNAAGSNKTATAKDDTSKNKDKDKKKEKDKKKKDGKEDPAAQGPRSTRLDQWQPEKIDKKNAFFVTIVGATAPENAYPVDVEVQPPLLLTDTAPRLEVKTGHSGAAKNTTVTILLDDKEVANRASLLGEAEGDDVGFSLPPSSVGVHVGKVQTAPDNLPIDDTFYFLIRVRETLPSLCIGEADDCFFVLKALNASLGGESNLRVKRIGTEELAQENLATYSCIFLCNGLPLPSQAEVLQLEQYVKDGGLLVMFPGDKANLADYQVMTCLPGTPTAVVEITSSLRKKMLRWERPQHPILRTLRLGPGGSPVVTVSKTLDFMNYNEDSEPLIVMGDKEPFLMSRDIGRGRVLLFSVTADRTWSTFPLSAFYLPIIHQVVQFGGAISGGTLYLLTTRDLSLTEYLPTAVQGTILQDPSKNNVAIRSSLMENKLVLRAEDLLTPGVYRMSKADSPEMEPALALNLDRVESNLTPVKREEIPKMLGVDMVQVANGKDELEKLIRDYRVGRTLGESCLWLALFLAMAEIFYANFKCRKVSTLSDALGVEASGKVTGSGSEEGKTA